MNPIVSDTRTFLPSISDDRVKVVNVVNSFVLVSLFSSVSILNNDVLPAEV